MSAATKEREENNESDLKRGTISVILDQITGNDGSSISSQNKALEFIEDGVLINYSAESPPLGSPEWKEIQLERTLQMRKLKVKSMKHNDNKDFNQNVQVTSSSPSRTGSNEIHTILKKTSSNSNSIGSPGKQPSNSNVTWKEPIAESKLLLPLNKSKVSRDEVAKALESGEKYNVKIARQNNANASQEAGSGTTSKVTIVSKKGSMKPLKKVSLPEEKEKNGSKSGNKNDGTHMRKKPKPPTYKKTREITSRAEISQQAKLNKNNLAVLKTLSVTPSLSPPPLGSGKKPAQASQKGMIGNGSGSPSPKNKRKSSSSSPTTLSLKSNKPPISVQADNNHNQGLKKTLKTKKDASEERSRSRQAKNAKQSNSNNNIINVNVQEKGVPSTSNERPTILPSTSAVKAGDNGINSIPSLPEKKAEEPEPRSQMPIGQLAIDKDDKEDREKGKSSGAFPKLLSTATQIIPLPPSMPPASSYFPHNEPTKKIAYGPLAVGDLRNSKEALLSKPIHSLLPPDDRKIGVTLGDSKISKKRTSSKLRIEELDGLLAKIKPPKLPDIEVCNVLPGTPEWDKYWNDFNAKMQDYYGQVEKHSRRLDSLLIDDDGLSYKKELAKREQEEKALKLCMGLPPKPPLIKQPLKETVEVGGYIIRPLGGYVPGAYITTHDHLTFRLEIHVEKIESELENISIDTKYNMMTITVPSLEKGNPFKKLIQITVPNYKKVQNLEVGHPLYNGGRIVVAGK